MCSHGPSHRDDLFTDVRSVPEDFIYDSRCCDVCQDHQLCSALGPTAAERLQEEIKTFLELDRDPDDVLGMLKRFESKSRSVGDVCLPLASPESDAGSALEVKPLGAGEAPVPICFESSGRVGGIRDHGRLRRRPSSDICLVNAFTKKCKRVRPLSDGTQDIDGKALECGKVLHAMEDASSGVGAFRVACQVEKARHDFLSVRSDRDVYMKPGAMRKRPHRSKALSLAGNGEAITKTISVQARGKRLPPAGFEERTYHFLNNVSPIAPFSFVYEYSLKRYRRSSFGLSQLPGLIEMMRSNDIFDSGCKEQELDAGVAPTASVPSDVHVIDVSDDDSYARSGNLAGVVKQETDGRRPLPSDVPLVMKAEPVPEIKRELGERPVVSSRVSLAKVSAAEVASPHAHTALEDEADTSRRREAPGQLVLTHAPVGSVIEAREQSPVKREGPNPDPHVR